MGISMVTPRSHCPSCRTTLYWYDLVPLFSWMYLRGKCRFCKVPISWLYPAIELLSACAFTALWLMVDHHYFPAYALFFSTLLVTIRTDTEHMLIARHMTFFLVPVGFIASCLGFIPLSITDSICGAFIGYGFLWLTRTGYRYRTGQEGIGQGDLDLMAYIGSFTGLVGVWITLTLGSCIGSMVGLLCAYQASASLRTYRIPFGLFLALSALILVLLYNTWYQLLTTYSV